MRFIEDTVVRIPERVIQIATAQLRLNDAGAASPCVEVVEACGEWHDRVVDGDQNRTLTFELESYPLAYAEGQPMRLGLDKLMRLVAHVDENVR